MTATTTAPSPLAAPAHPRQALAMIEARLGRAPADALEAAVVLEAWGGLRPEAALDLGELVMEVVPEGTTRRLRPPIVKTPQRSNWLAEILGLAGFVSMATWGVPLGQALPSVNVDIAFRVGVPLALALQWLTRRRYFSGERKLGSFGTDGRAFALVFTLSLCLFLVGGETGLLLVGLEVLWFSGYLLAKDDWGLLYGIALVGVTAALYDGWPPQILLPVVAFVLLATAVWRVQRHDRARRQKTERNMPIGIFEALPSALIGGALGVMMVFSLTHLRPNGWMLAVALLPAGVASLVAAGILRTLWYRLDVVLAHARGREVETAGARRVSSRLGSAWIAYFVTCAALSVAAAPVLIDGGRSIIPTMLLLGGFGLFCALAMVTDLQHSWNRIPWALAIAVPACGVELGVRMLFATSAAALTLGAATGLLIALIPMIGICRSPGRMIATSVAIP